MFWFGAILDQVYHDGEGGFINPALEVAADLEGLVQSVSDLLLFALPHSAGQTVHYNLNYTAISISITIH
jgi:hypothetical protein